MGEHWERVYFRKSLQDNLFLVVSGPSGGGKTTFIRELVKNIDNIDLLIKSTSRMPRKNELDCVDYYFLSESEFEKQINEDTALVIVKRYGHGYALLLDEVNKCIQKNRIPCFILDPDAALSFKQTYTKSVIVYVAPTNIEDDIKRVKERKEDAIEENERLSMINREYGLRDLFDVNVYCNDADEQAVNDIKHFLEE